MRITPGASLIRRTAFEADGGFDIRLSGTRTTTRFCDYFEQDTTIFFLNVRCHSGASSKDRPVAQAGCVRDDLATDYRNEPARYSGHTPSWEAWEEGRCNLGRGAVTVRYRATGFNLADGSNTNVGLFLASNGEK